MTSAVPVLMYHHIAPDREVTPPEFELQLRHLQTGGWNTITLSEMADHLSGKKPLSGKNVMLTFDDGYADNWVWAYPLLKKYAMNAVVFLTTCRIGEGPVRPLHEGCLDTRTAERVPDGFLRWDEVRAMSEEGVFEIGSHTHTHKNFDKAARYPDIVQELQRSASVIKEELGILPVSLAWPWGYYEKDFPARAAECGYKLVFTTRGGSNCKGTDPLAIKRFKVQNGDLRWLDARLWLYSTCLGDIYGQIYGLNSRLKHKILSLFRGA